MNIPLIFPPINHFTQQPQSISAYTIKRETFEGENFHELVKNTICMEKLSQIARFCRVKGLAQNDENFDPRQ